MEILNVENGEYPADFLDWSACCHLNDMFEKLVWIVYSGFW
jgi:hypothetical protein